MGNIGNQGMSAIKVFAAGSVIGGVTGGVALSALGTGAGLTTLGTIPVDVSLTLLPTQPVATITYASRHRFLRSAGPDIHLVFQTLKSRHRRLSVFVPVPKQFVESLGVFRNCLDRCFCAC
jgi:hypothetical protein